MVAAIEKECKRDPMVCCRHLFKNWLTTENGISPKTWETLLTKLREVEELVYIVDDIVESKWQWF